MNHVWVRRPSVTGRCNLYSIRTDVPRGLPIQRGVDIGSLLDAWSRKSAPATQSG